MPVTAKENMDPPHRKDSTSGGGGGGGGGGLEFVTTRFPTAATAPRVSVNPLQFVKVAPPKLFVPPAGGLPSAAEREKEEKERRRKLSQAAEEDWQANLDNWKSSRLKRVEHIVERVEEVRRVEQEDSVWSVTGRRKSKTFNEMMEERSTRGVRKTSLGLIGLSYPADDDDGEDVFSSGTAGGDAGCAPSKDQQDWGAGSDRGTSATSSLSGLDSGGQVSEAETEKEAPAVKENGTKVEDNNNNNDTSNNGNEGDNGNHGEGPEEEIYTYERAIQEYVNYTERRNSGGVAVMERKNGEVTATLPDVRNGVSDGPSSPKKQSNGPSTFESVKNSMQSWTVDEEAEDGSGETEEETEEEVLRRISFKEKLASFRNLENSKVNNLPAPTVDVHVPDAKEKNCQLIKSKTEVQDDKVVVYHANEDSGIHTGDASQSEGEGEISTPMCKNAKQELTKTMDSSGESVVKDQKCDGVAKSDSEKKQGGGSTVLLPDVSRKELTIESCEPSKPKEETPIQPKSESTSSPSSTLPTPIKSPAKPRKPELTKSGSKAETKSVTPPVSPPTKSPRTPPVPPPRPSHKQIVSAPEVSPNTACPSQKTPEVSPQESTPFGNMLPTTPESPKRTLEPSKEVNQTKGSYAEPLGDSVNSSPVKSGTLDASACMKVVNVNTQSMSPAAPEKISPPVASVEAPAVVSVPPKEVDLVSSEAIVKKDDHPLIDNSCSTSALHGDAVVVAKHIKESSLDHSSGYSSAETSSSQQSVGIPKVVPNLLSESTMMPPSMGELRGLEALDALLSATPPPSTPLPPILDLTSEDVHVVGGLGFALGTPAKTLTPPKEKPPPPPTSSPPSTPTGSLTRKSTGSSPGSGVGDFRRRNSTKRIRKEIRRKRSDFLGIDAGHEGSDGDGEDIADELEPPELLTISRDVPTSSECTAEEEDEEDGEYGEEDVEQELVRLQEQEPSPTPHCGLDVSSSPLPGETEEEEEEERSSCQTQETDSGVELTEKDREDRRGKKIVEVEEIEERRISRIQEIQGLYEKEVEAKKNVNNQYYGPVVAEPASAIHHQSMQDVRMREVVNEEPVLLSREEPIHTCPPATLRRSLPDFACADGGDSGHPQQINHSEQPPWRRPQPPPVPPHKPRPIPPAEVTPTPPKTNMRQAHLRALNVPPKPRIIPTDGWVSPEVRSSHPYDWNGSPQHPLNPTNTPHQTNHPFANSLPRNHMLMQGGAPVRSPERRASQPSGYPIGNPVKNDGIHPGSVDGIQREERDSVPRRKKTDGSGGYNYQHWLIQEAEHRRITEMQDRRRSHNGVPTSRESGAEEPVTNGSPSRGKPLPDSIIQTLTQRVQGRTAAMSSPNHRSQEPQHTRSEGRPKSADMSIIHRQLQNSPRHPQQQQQQRSSLPGQPPSEKMLSVSGKKKCSHCSQELGRGAAMIIESLRLFYHIGCFRCCVCHAQLGDGLVGADVRVRAGRLHCHHCYSSDDGVKFSCV